MEAGEEDVMFLLLVHTSDSKSVINIIPSFPKGVVTDPLLHNIHLKSNLKHSLTQLAV